MTSSILGISAFYHDSAAALVSDGGEIVAAAQEERFSRIKHDASFPTQAIRYVLDEAGAELADLRAIAFYDKPFLKFERLLETSHAFAPRGLRSFLTAMPVWIKEKIFMRNLLRRELEKIGNKKDVANITILFPEHHLSHAASAFYPSPFSEAAILTIDGVGEWATTTISHGCGNQITLRKELQFPHSLGLLYSAATYYCGFRVNSGEYKLMGLAPFADPNSPRVRHFLTLLYEHLIDLKEDGSFFLNMDFFAFAIGSTMCHDRKWKEVFGLDRRVPESELDMAHIDLALAFQLATEEIVIRLAHTARQLCGCNNLVMAGGVALNCVANGKLLDSKIFKNLWIQPAAGDDGGALGSALAAHHIWLKRPRATDPTEKSDQMRGALLGPEFSNIDIARLCRRYAIAAKTYHDEDELLHTVANLLTEGKVVGWFQGRMEYGPRALGNRSILADPRNPGMQKKLNLEIKFRESFRPFAAAVLEEDCSKYFVLEEKSPYMLLVRALQPEHRFAMEDPSLGRDIYSQIGRPRSILPAITHVDYSCRVQTVSRQDNRRFRLLLENFKKLSGLGILVNTSFNRRGEPIVCTPEDAYQCFITTGMDYLVINDFIFHKDDSHRPNSSITS